jgi:hypothetical protein
MMINPELAAALVKARQDDAIREASLSRSAGRAHGSRLAVGRRSAAVRSPERGVLLAKAAELVRLAANSGYGRDELVRMIQSIS